MPWRAAVCVSLCSTLAVAQADAIFGAGKPVTSKEEDVDARFAKSKVARALKDGSQDANCRAMLTGFLAALAEVGPTLHRRDETFTVDPGLVQGIQMQLSSPRFNGPAYLSVMVRRVLIDRRLPDEWLATAQKLQPASGPIDLGKLLWMNEAFRPIDSFEFTLPRLLQQHEVEVVRANSAATVDPWQTFRDTYLDREVFWGQLTLVDAGLLKSKSKEKKKGKRAVVPPADAPITAILHWSPPGQDDSLSVVMGRKKKAPAHIVQAQLTARQYASVERIPKGSRVAVRGRLHDMTRDAKGSELRDALLFVDRDFSAGIPFIPEGVAGACPFAVNELQGISDANKGFHR